MRVPILTCLSLLLVSCHPSTDWKGPAPGVSERWSVASPVAPSASTPEASATPPHWPNARATEPSMDDTWSVESVHSRFIVKRMRQYIDAGEVVWYLSVYAIPHLGDTSRLLSAMNSQPGVFATPIMQPNLDLRASRGFFRLIVSAPPRCTAENAGRKVVVHLTEVLNDPHQTKIEEDVELDDWCVIALTPRIPDDLNHYTKAK